MEKITLFTEKQKFNQWWVLSFLAILNLFISYEVFNQFQDSSTIDIGIYSALGVIILLNLLFYLMKLETVIKNDGIYVRLFPFHLKYKKYTWDILRLTYIRKYKPLWEYGGWGLRIGAKGYAYNVSGNIGLQLKIVNRTDLLVGTKKPTELKEVLTSLGKYKEPTSNTPSANRISEIA